MKTALISDEAESGVPKLITEKSQSMWRWVVLVLCCLMMVGNYYSYDIPAALKSPLDDYMGNPDNFETLFSLLYTVYSIPNTVLPLFGGYIVDKFGFARCAVLFLVLILGGQAVFALGVSVKNWPVMFTGRVIFGFGGESISVANSAILAEYFIGKELAFSFGVGLSIARLGSVINNLISPSLEQGISLTFAFWFGTFLCAGSLVSTISIYYIDRIMNRMIKKNKRKLVEGGNAGPALLESSLNSPLLIDGENGEEEEAEELVVNDVKLSDGLSLPWPFWLLTISCVVVYGCVLPFNNVASSLLMERDYFKAQSSDSCALVYQGCPNSTNVPNDACDTSHWYAPPLPYYYDYEGSGEYKQLEDEDVDCNDDYWSETCTKDYCDGKDDAEVQATLIMSIPYFISAALSPFLGKFVDVFGQRAVIAAIAPGLLIGVHTMLGYSDVSPVGPLVGQGLAYSGFAAVIWPSIPLVVEKKFIGLAYGLCTCLQNVGLGIFPVIIAAIYEATDHTYIPEVELFFVALAVLGFLVGLYLNVYDYYNGHVFNHPAVDKGDVDNAKDTMNKKMSIGSFTVPEVVAVARGRLVSR